MTITKDRQKVLLFSPGYYFTPAQIAARKGSGITSMADLSGKSVCVGSGTTYETYLNGEDVGIPDSDIKVTAPGGVKVVALSTDSECAQSIQAGRTDFDAFMTSGTVVDQAIAQGINVEKVGGPAYVENLAVAIDKKSPKDTKSLLDAISKAVTDMHGDGTLESIVDEMVQCRPDYGAVSHGSSTRFGEQPQPSCGCSRFNANSTFAREGYSNATYFRP